MNLRLKEIREDLGYSQIELAKILEVSPATISKYEKGSLKINKRTATRICNTLDINKEWFMTGEGEKYYKQDLDIAYMIGKVFSDNDEFLKKVFITFSKLKDSERAVIMKVINELSDKK